MTTPEYVALLIASAFLALMQFVCWVYSVSRLNEQEQTIEKLRDELNILKERVK